MIAPTTPGASPVPGPATGPASATSTGSQPLPPADGPRAPLDDTLDPRDDKISALASSVARRAQLMLLSQQSNQQALQLRLDRMRVDFNAAQELRSEQLREMNALRDMAVEQGKKDDEILKKYIAMI